MSALMSPTFLNHPVDYYETFVREKVAFDKTFGFPVHAGDLSLALESHQRNIVRRPADLGHLDEGSDLPDVTVEWHKPEADAVAIDYFGEEPAA